MVSLSFLDWIALIILRFHLPEPFAIKNWLPLTINGDSVVLSISENSWILLFALATLMVGILLSSSSHIQEPRIFPIWIETLLLTAVGMLLLLADSVLAFLLLWVMIDLVEIIIFTIINQEKIIKVQTYAIFLGRILGLGLVMWACFIGFKNQIPLSLDSVDQSTLLLLVAGASLRLGVLPLHLPYTLEVPQRRSVSTILRFLAPLSAFLFLSKIPAPQSINGFFLFIYLLALLSCLVGSINWVIAKDELEGRPYWLLAFSGFSIISYFHGQPVSVLIWGLLMVCTGGWIFLSESQKRKFNFLLIIAMVTLCGLPFSPASIAFLGIAGGTLKVFNPLIWISLDLLMIGLAQFSVSEKNPPDNQSLENWMRLFRGFGLSGLLLSSWVVIILQTKGWNQLQTLPAQITAVILFILMLIVFISKDIKQKIQNSGVYQIHNVMTPFARFINNVFHFDWFYKLLESLLNFQARINSWVNSLLEGEGGILWSLVFLAVLISLLVNGVGLHG